MKVIDISDWQENINWDEVVNAGVEGVIIKATEGQSKQSCYDAFLSECKNRGLKWGVYCFTKAQTPDDAGAEAQTILDILGGETPPLGIWYDCEYENLPSDPAGCCSAFVCACNEAGQQAGIYTGYRVFNEGYMQPDDLADYVPWWFAEYNSTCDFGAFTSDCHLAGWQYSEKGDIGCDGVNCRNVDLNEWYD